jgi:zinc protease
MIDYKKKTLGNGLKVIINEDKTTPLAAFNVLYDVGARDEVAQKTGFAHLFEHLMFSGSKNVAHFDEAIQMAGGTNNAFTSNDITNYYISLPAVNIETAFFVDSDRMNYLDVSNKSIDIQRDVVIEEFNQRYLNQPYGEAMLLLRPLVYKAHPYQWATIGKNTKHIEDATLVDVADFYKNHYNPNRAILSISGNVESDKMFDLAEKWFGGIQNNGEYLRNLPVEAEQLEYRKIEVEKDVPVDSIYMAFVMCERIHPDYYAIDLMSDILSRGDSSRFYQRLVRDRSLMSSVNAYITGSTDQGMFIVSGKVAQGISLEEVETAIFEELSLLNTVSEGELQKVKNKTISSNKFGEVGGVNRAMNLGYYELLGKVSDVNNQNDYYGAVSVGDIKRVSNEIFKKEKASVLYYKSKKKV